MRNGIKALAILSSLAIVGVASAQTTVPNLLAGGVGGFVFIGTWLILWFRYLFSGGGFLGN